MSDLPSSRAKIQTEATRFRAAVSESLAQDIGSSINYLIDERDSLQAEVNAILAAGDTYVVTGNGSNQWPGSQNVFSITHTFAATDYVSLEFNNGVFGLTASNSGFPSFSDVTDLNTFNSAPFIGGGRAESFLLQLYLDSSIVTSASGGDGGVDRRIYLTPHPIFFQPGAGSHTIRLYKSGGSIGVFSGKMILKVHKNL
mgnify:CR=1 FL=1